MRINRRQGVLLWLLAGMPAFGLSAGQADIAYLRHSEGYWQVWLTDEEGQAHRQLTTDPIDKTRVSWSEDRSELLYNRNDGQLMRLPLEGGTPAAVNLPLNGMLDAQWSPDGQSIAFSKTSAQSLDNNDLWLIRTTGKNPKKITNQPGMEHSPSWNNEGTALVFSGGKPQQNFEIWEIDLASLQLNQLTVGAAFCVDPSYSPGGDITYSSNKAGNYDIWRYDRETGQSSQLTKDPAYDAQPTWSPDGEQIAFYSRRDGNKRIWVLDVDGNNPRPITPEQAMSRYPVWSR